MLYRATAARSVLRAVSSSNASVARSVLGNPIFKAQLTSSARAIRTAVKPSFALAAHKPVTTALVRYASTSAKVRASQQWNWQQRSIQWLISYFLCAPRKVKTST